MSVCGLAIFDSAINKTRRLRTEWQNSIKMREVFFDCACMLARRQKSTEAAAMLLRAVNHGFCNLGLFEKELVEMNLQNMLKMIQETADYATIQTILKKKTDTDER